MGCYTRYNNNKMVVERIVTVTAMPSLKLAFSFASGTPGLPWIIINGTVVPMFACCPVILTGNKRRPEIAVKDGDINPEKRHDDLFGLNIMEQIAWFLDWKPEESMSSQTYFEHGRKKVTRRANVIKPSRDRYIQPTHIFCDPASARTTSKESFSAPAPASSPPPAGAAATATGAAAE